MRKQSMQTLQKKLEQREKSELIGIIEQMLRQAPDLHWVLTTPHGHQGDR
jgi:hypothetical protein